MKTNFNALLADVRACRLCAAQLPDGVRPVVQALPSARILVASQAPGRRVHLSGVPFDDASGERLLSWLGISREIFNDPSRVAIVPMGFCYPGTGPNGDLAPRPECAPAWRSRLLAGLPEIELSLLVGAYAQTWHLNRPRSTVTDIVSDWKQYWPTVVPLPHPSPRNNIWLKRNPWFEIELVPALRQRVAKLLNRGLDNTDRHILKPSGVRD